MLHETLKTLRKQKGYSQEEMASRLNVVRQTVSKWEKGLSVPDADILVRIAELFEVSVGDLLGKPAEAEPAPQNTPDFSEIADQLSRINEQLVIRNRRSRRIWRTIAAVVIGIFVLFNLTVLLSVVAFHAYRTVDASFTAEEYSYTIDGEITTEDKTIVIEE